ncbi:MAG TPA: 2OG-Fe(II) oxygenase, partial [Vicinamibacteria bacterium]|nr:2OG-Fe(II) oxygenase [Vicinamibacteria bacterium]
MNRYLKALEEIPCGETRSFQELAAMAGAPGTARAAGRAVAGCDTSSELPWHRVVRADGRPGASPRAETQRRRLKKEGARPRRSESLSGWVARLGVRFVGHYLTREYATVSQLGALRWNADRVEPLRDEESVLARGFRPLGSGESPPVALPEPRRVHRSSRGSGLEERLGRISWKRARRELAECGFSRLQKLLSASECSSILSESSDPSRFERSVNMAPRGYGIGAYHYYREPLPEPLGRLRHRLYESIAPPDYPTDLFEFWQRCRDRGQNRPSSILIGYEQGGINHLHRDIYGPVWFPYQALVMLSRRERDFEGGEFLLENEGSISNIPVSEGDVVIFCSRPQRHGM